MCAAPLLRGECVEDVSDAVRLLEFANAKETQREVDALVRASGSKVAEIDAWRELNSHF